MTALPLEVTNFFLAMQAGRPGAAALETAFAPDAVYEEPFTGETRRHKGRAAIMAAMAMGWEMPMLDTRIELRAARIGGNRIEVDWTCHSPSLPGGKGSGRNRFTLENGLITSLITTLEEAEE